MSRLFLATERALGRTIVVKVLPPEFGSEVSAARFRREIELTARLQHPNILGVLTAGVDGDLVWYAMPYVEGESLRRRLDRDGRLPVPTATRLLREVADALQYAHQRGVIHRDVKPENILLAADHALLADFGIAQALVLSRGDERLTVSGMSLGTPGYMAPEQAAAGAVDARADLYSLGLVGWEMLAGEAPFKGDAQAVLTAHLTKTAPPLRDVRPETPQSLTAAVARALEKDPAARFNSAAEFRDALDVAPSRAAAVVSRRTAGGLVAVAGLAAAAFFTWRATRSPDTSALDANVIAVAPFDVHDTALSFWREGLADIIARNLDGAGPLRAIPPTLVVRRWQGLADPASARALGNRTGAGLALYGALTRAGRDSVRLRASLLDVATGRTIQDVDLRDDAEHVDRLADSTAVWLLRELGRTRSVGAARLTSIGSRSIPALKAFLRGEQLYRNGFMDSAHAEYERATALDTTFGLAFNRLAETIGWLGSDTDSLALALRLRAGVYTQGLARRDSLLVLADSNHAAGLLAQTDTGTWRHARRTLALLNAAGREYPLDPQIWNALGEESIHQVHFAPAPAAAILARFEHAIEIDSQFTPAYPHAIELAAAMHDTAKVQRLIAARRKWRPTAGQPALHLDALEVLLARGLAVLDSAAPTSRIAHSLTQSLGYLLDSTESGVVVSRRYVELASVQGGRMDHAREHLASALAYRGHVREAATIGAQNPRFIAELALLGGFTRDSASNVFDTWLRTRVSHARLALSYWALHGDSARARRLLAQMEERARGSQPSLSRTLAEQGIAEARFFLALARHDTVSAVRLIPQLVDSLCLDGCDLIRFAKARVLASEGRNEEAQQLFTPAYRTIVAPLMPLFLLEHARVSERLGQRELALRDYQFVARAWSRADPELRAYVDESSQAIERLGGGKDRPASRSVPRRP
jgi:eukaryotic-like serine/threonine-protein kinase